MTKGRGHDASSLNKWAEIIVGIIDIIIVILTVEIYYKEIL